jgi:hypothetical protein
MEEDGEAERVSLSSPTTTSPEITSFEFSGAMEEDGEAERVSLPSPTTTSPEITSFEFSGAMEEDGEAERVSTPGTSPAPPEEGNPELAMKQELDLISQMIPRSPMLSREETHTPLSELRHDGQGESAGTNNHAVPTADSIVRPESSLSSLSSYESESVSEVQPLSKSLAVPARIQAPPRRSKRKPTGPPSQNQQQVKRVKVKLEGTEVHSTKQTIGQSRKNTAQPETARNLSSRSKSNSVSPVSGEWPAKAEDESRYDGVSNQHDYEIWY